ncbi:unnamed protein product [Meloidogyne enterolobii]|uniref:Uncharacterized protein n=1 Tax=Meloidogyne enterolobii TaxID=390850 RepID=A0ACB0Y2J3_MELEN
MGLTKDFLKFQQSGFFNLLASPNGMVQFVDSVTCAVAAAENVSFYNMRTLAKTKQIRFEGRIVTSFALTKDKSKIAVGYDNGPPIVFNGHKTGVNCLAFSDDGFILASGGKDSVIALWDVLNESGICSLFGHKGTITHLRFVQNELYLVSSSKDTQIRFWSLLNKCCFYLLAESQSEIYSFAFLNKENLLVVANSEIELSVFELKWNKEIKEENDDEEILDDLNVKRICSEDVNNNDNELLKDQANVLKDQANKVLQCKKRGSLLRQAKGRALQLSVSSDEAILCCVGADSLVDIYRFFCLFNYFKNILRNFTEEESSKRFRRKLRKLRQRLEIQENEENKDDLSTQMLKLENEVRKDITTIIARIGDYRADSKVKWIDICDSFTVLPNGRTREYRFYCLLKSNNVLGVSIRVDWKNSATESFLLTSLGQRVHRTDIRALAISSKSDIIVTGSNESAIVWDLQELVSLNKLIADGLQQISAALLFANDTQLILGTRTGSLFLFNLKTCELIEKSDSVHDSITGLCAFPNKDGFVSFGQDKKARFWCFERAKDSSDRDYLSIRSKRVLELQDEPLCAAISPNGKFIAFGLLDNTSRVFFMDSLKYFVSLYGHSLPIYCIDISHDNKLIITGSGDKSVRIWGLDFGDCHRSLFAHDGNNGML